MQLFRAFVAGLVVPSIILPIVLLLAWWSGDNDFIGVLPLHMLPVVWGIWNILYFAICRNLLPGSVDLRLLLTGGILGLIVAYIGVFVIGVPGMIGIPQSFQFYPIVVAPIAYALVWRFFVKRLNDMVGLTN